MRGSFVRQLTCLEICAGAGGLLGDGLIGVDRHALCLWLVDDLGVDHVLLGGGVIVAVGRCAVAVGCC